MPRQDHLDRCTRIVDGLEDYAGNGRCDLGASREGNAEPGAHKRENGRLACSVCTSVGSSTKDERIEFSPCLTVLPFLDQNIFALQIVPA